MENWHLKYQGHIASVGITYPDSSFLSLKSSHGYSLANYRFHHDSPKALIFLFHGMYMSSYDLSHVAKQLHENDFAVLALDQECHGNSEGKKGEVTNIETYSDSCEEFILKAKELYPPHTPVFCIGLSMGAALSIMVCLKNPDLVNGIVLFAPGIAVDPNFKPILQRLVRCLNCCCCGGLGLTASDPESMSRNEYFTGYCDENPENYHGKVKVRTAVALLNLSKKFRTRIEEFSNPVLVFHGEKDLIASCAQAKEFIKNCKSVDKEIVVYPEMRHMVNHEPEFPEIMQKTIKWINERIVISSII